MPSLVLVSVLAAVLPLALLAHVAVRQPGRQVAIAHRNLTRGLASTTVEVGSLESRGNGWTAMLRVVTPEREARRARRLLQGAGQPAGWTMTRVLTAKPLLVVAVATASFPVVSGPPGPAWLLGAVAVAVYWLPDLVLHSRGEEHQKGLAQELPDILDQMTIAVEAGLGFEAAMSWVAGNGTGKLAEEFRRTLADIAMGRPRREAYQLLVDRTQAVDLRRFVAAVNQADQYGIAMADVLRVQAAEMRVKRRQRAEEKAMKVPVKVSFPLMLCILPALLMVVVGPAVLAIGDVLG